MKSKVLVLVLLISIFATSAIGAKFEFNPRPYVSTEYSDNLFLDTADEEDDYIVTLSPAFDISFLGKTAGLEMSYEPAYQFYEQNDDLDDWTHNAGLYAFSNFSKRTRFDLANRFLFTRNPLGDQDVVRDGRVVIPGDPTNRTGREQYYTNTLNAGVNHQFGVDDSLNVAFLYRILRNDDPAFEDNDRYEPSIGLNYWFGPKFGTELRGSYTRGLFDQQSDSTGIPTDDFDNWFGSIRLIGKTSQHFSVYGQYGQVYRKFDGDLNNDYLGYSPSAGILYLMDENLTLSLGLGYYYQAVDGGNDNDGFYPAFEINKIWNFRRGLIDLTGAGGLEQQNFGAQNLDLARYGILRAEGRYDFTRNFNGLLFGRLRYSEPTDTDQSGGIEDQLRTSVGAGIGYRILKWMSLGLAYRLSNYTATGDLDWAENHAMFQIVLEPDQPWRF
jgi:hypothetical protein